jgi:SagB-type dehydrogenase family enzyme
MTRDTRVVTSPLFFVRPGGDGIVGLDGLKGQRYESVSMDAFRLMQLFLEPKTVAEAVHCGVDDATIQDALEAGILVDADTAEARAALLWEAHNWSRAAYLLFSQMDLSYMEFHRSLEYASLQELTQLRRKVIQAYQKASQYPPQRSPRGSCSISLPEPVGERCVDLDAMLRRRSVRSFSGEPVDLRTFGDVLFDATRNYRAAEATKVGGDPYYLLNSFYSWLRLSVIAQGITGLERGVYDYDPAAHRLVKIRGGVEDREIAACIQYQTWIGGAGWCLFVCVHWERYMWIYRHARAYINLLVQLGEFGLELLQATYSCGLGAWMTPAVHESRAARLLALDPSEEEAMYFFKIGPPRLEAGAVNEGL